MTLLRKDLTEIGTLSEMPDDVLFVIFSHCDLVTMGRLARVSTRINYLIGQDCNWLRISKGLTLVRNSRTRVSKPSVSLRDHCRISLNWKKGHAVTGKLVQYRIRQLPWLQLDEGGDLWVSHKNLIHCYPQGRRPRGKTKHEKVINAHTSDLSRFVCKQQTVISGSICGSLCCFDAISGRCLTRLEDCHNGDVQSVDLHPDSVVISASRDTAVKLWRHCSEGIGCALRTMHACDRVLSVALSHDAGSFVTGTAGMNSIPPLRVWHTETAALLCTLGSGYKDGAGVLDARYDSPTELLSCGYDTFIRFWDLRLSHHKCVIQWEEPFDSTVYCVKSDGGNAVIAGTARNGLVLLCDKRSPRPLQYFYAGRNRSPVYSVDFDAANLYVALDRSVMTLDFNTSIPQHKRITTNSTYNHGLN